MRRSLAFAPVKDNHAGRNRTDHQEPGDAGEPVVYAVGKTVRGWRFSRREFLAAAGVAATAATAAGCAGKTTSTPAAQSTLSPDEAAAQEKASACRDADAHKNYVNSVAISPDGALLASGGNDKTIKLWSLPEGSAAQDPGGPSQVGQLRSDQPGRAVGVREPR